MSKSLQIHTNGSSINSDHLSYQVQLYGERSTLGFSSFLQETKSKPMLFILHDTIEYPKKRDQELRASQNLDVFIDNYRKEKNIKNALTTAFVLGFSSAGWQVAADFSDPDNLFIYSASTGALAAAFLSMASFLILPKSWGSALTCFSKLAPACLVDSFWQPVWVSTENPGVHIMLYLLVGMLYIEAQSLTSLAMSKTCCRKPNLIQDLATTTWSTPLLLAEGYLGFGYLMPILPFSFKPLAAFFSSFLPILTHGLVDYAVVSKNVSDLEERYVEFKGSTQKSEYEYHEAENSDGPSPRSTPCTSLLKNCFSFCSSWIYPRDSESEHASILGYEHS